MGKSMLFYFLSRITNIYSLTQCVGALYVHIFVRATLNLSIFKSN